MAARIRAVLLALVLVLQLAAVLSAVPLEALLSSRARTVRLAADLYDPVHLMKGRYVALTFDIPSVPVWDLPGLSGKTDAELDALDGEELFCLFSESGPDGLSRIEDLREERPRGGDWYVRGCALRVERSEGGAALVSVDFPADRYYLQETLAGEAERLMGESETPAALVAKVGRSGSFAVVGLELGGRPVEELAAEER
jgi:hypothetical protein